MTIFASLALSSTLVAGNMYEIEHSFANLYSAQTRIFDIDVNALSAIQKNDFYQRYVYHTNQAFQALQNAMNASQCITPQEAKDGTRNAIAAAAASTQLQGGRAKMIAVAIAVLVGYISGAPDKYADVQTYLRYAQHHEELAVFYMNILLQDE